MKINELVRLSDSISAEVNVLRDFSYKDPEGNLAKIGGYLPNKSSRIIFQSILESCAEATDRKFHLITASYGTGKSYLLLMLANLLSGATEESLNKFIEKVENKQSSYSDNLSQVIKNHLALKSKFLTVIPEYADSNFDHALLEGLKFALKEKGLDYTPNTNYEAAVQTLNHYKSTGNENFKRFEQKLGGESIAHFIEQLSKYTIDAYTQFKTFYKEINGSEFAETHSSAYPIFEDIAKKIRVNGYRGIAIIYDEFGEMLTKLINSSSTQTGLQVQDFLEKVKDQRGANILFISATHQDPNAYQIIKDKELNKIVGRADRHQLIISEAEGEEIMGTVFIKQPNPALEIICSAEFIDSNYQAQNKFDLYRERDEEWVKQVVIEDLYPLHPLTSYILPRLSAEFAQNTRSMFNFLNPYETKDGAFRYYLEETDVRKGSYINLYTPDLLLEFFLQNIKTEEGRSGSLRMSYENALGKAEHPDEVKIIKNIFVLGIINKANIKPYRATLFWAMNWAASRLSEFNLLLDELVHKDYLELNPTQHTYGFPDTGATPLAVLIEEEKRNLSGFMLSNCMDVWKGLKPEETVLLRDHFNTYGANRTLKSVYANHQETVAGHLKELAAYYNYNTERYSGSGIIFYLIAGSDDDLNDLKNVIQNYPSLNPYIVFSSPKNLAQFEALRQSTIYFKAVQNTSKRDDVSQNPARLTKIKQQEATARISLEDKLGELFMPENWDWNYATMTNFQLNSKQQLNNWLNMQYDQLFSDTPILKDDALWFANDSAKKRADLNRAFSQIFNAAEDRIPIRDESNSSSENRIIKNFFTLDLKRLTQRDLNIQFGEIAVPPPDSKIHAAWELINELLKDDNLLNPKDLIVSLTKAPFGFSAYLIKFLLGVYIRLDRDRIVIKMDKGVTTLMMSSELIDKIMSKPSDYRIRKIKVTAPEMFYISRLKTLFKEQTYNSFPDIAKQFVNFYQFLTPFLKTIVKEHGGTMQSFYEALDQLNKQLLPKGADVSGISLNFFLEIVPMLIIQEGAEFLADKDKVNKIIVQLENFKNYPGQTELIKKYEVLSAIAKDAFDEQIGTKNDFLPLVSKWLKGLPAVNQTAKFGDVKINKWLSEIKSPSINDPYELYLEELSLSPLKKWEDISFEKHQIVQQYKGFRKTVEEYTKSPNEILQAIAREAFNCAAKDCEDEIAFNNLVSNWYSELSDEKKELHYSTLSNTLLSHISDGASIKTKYLEIIPNEWRMKGGVPAHLNQEWESWDNGEIHIVCKAYLDAVSEINTWLPPISETQFSEEIGYLFQEEKLETFNALFKVVKAWYDDLPLHTKQHHALISEHIIANLFSSLNSESDFKAFFLNEFSDANNLPAFSSWNLQILKQYKVSLSRLITRIQKFKRSSNEVIIKIAQAMKSEEKNSMAFFFDQKKQLKKSEAFKNEIELSELKDDMSRKLLESVRNELTPEQTIEFISDSVGITPNWHFWSLKDEAEFIKAYKQAFKEILAWKFPEEAMLKKAKLQVKPIVDKLLIDLSLSKSQLYKILRDIIEEGGSA